MGAVQPGLCVTLCGRNQSVMAEYNLSFAEHLLEAAKFVAAESLVEIDAKRTVLYLSLLASEIVLKSLLEAAGKPVSQLRKRSHSLEKLLGDLDNCRITVEVAPGHHAMCSASRLRAVVVNSNYANATVGAMLGAADREASKYPSQIRYGGSLKHFPAHLMLEMSLSILEWAKNHYNSIRLIMPTNKSKGSEEDSQSKAIDFIYTYRDAFTAIRATPAGSEWLRMVQENNLRNGYILKQKDPQLLMSIVEKIDESLLSTGLQGSVKSAYQLLSSSQRIRVIEIVLNMSNPWELKSLAVNDFINRDLDFYEGKRDGSVPSSYYGRWDEE